MSFTEIVQKSTTPHREHSSEDDCFNLASLEQACCESFRACARGGGFKVNERSSISSSKDDVAYSLFCPSIGGSNILPVGMRAEVGR